MKKHILILGLILMFMGLVMNAQTTVSIPHLTEVEGAVVVPVEVSPGLGTVGSVSLHITYDETVLEFTGFSNNPFEGDPNFLTNLKAGEITVGWYSLTPVEITNKIFDLNFNYSGGSSAIAFTGTNELTDENAQIYTVSFVDGSIGPEPVTLSLSEEIAIPGDTVSVSIDALNVRDAGSFTLYVDFDSDILTFVGTENDNVGFSVSDGASGTVTLAWFDETTTAPFTMLDGKLVDLVFEFAGGNSDVGFAAESEVTDAGGNPISVVLVDGFVKEPGMSLILPDVEGHRNSEVVVPLKGQLLENLGSFTLDIDYNASLLSFNRFEGLVGGELVVNEEVTDDAATLSMAYYNTAGLTMADDVIVNLVYDIGDVDLGSFSSLRFGSDGEVTDVDGGLLDIDLIDGSVTVVHQAPYFTATLDGENFIPEYFSETDTWNTYTFQYEAVDPEDSSLTYTMVSGPAGASVSASGLFSWAPTDEDANSSFTVVVEVSDGDLAVIDTSDITTGNILDVKDDDVIPTEFNLEQNYPNPFNPATTIKFGLPEQADVSLKIFNILGQEIKTLINRNLSAGYHTVNFDASNLISGMYIYRIQATSVDGSNFVDVKKMLLIK